MLAREIGGTAAMFGAEPTQLDNQRKINDFEHKLNHAKDLFQKTYPQTESERRAEQDNPPWTNAEFVEKQEIAGEITRAESELEVMKKIYVLIEDTRDDPNGYGEYQLQQRDFDETGENFQEEANEALEGLRDPQTFGGDVREVGRDIKDTAGNFWDWIRS